MAHFLRHFGLTGFRAGIFALMLMPGLAGATPPGAVVLGTADDEQPVEFEIGLPSRDPAGLAAFTAAQQVPGSVAYHQWLTPQSFNDRFGPDPSVAARATDILAAAGFAVKATHPKGLTVTGTAGAARQSFGTSFDLVQTSTGGTAVSARGGLTLPSPLSGLGAEIIGFDGFVRQRVMAKPVGGFGVLNRTSTLGGYWFSDLKQAYDAPSVQSLTGKGRVIAVLMSGDISDADTKAYFAHEGMAPPSVTRIEVNGGARYSANSEGSFEASLDVQQAAGMAPGASILLYLVPSLSDSDILAGLRRIVADNKADIVTMSFGGCEKMYTAAYNGGTDYTSMLKTYESIFAMGAAQGISFVAASGDDGGLQCPAAAYFNGARLSSWVAGASSPATSPSVTGVGGTNLVTTHTPGSEISTYVSENANGDPEIAGNPYGIRGATLTGGYYGSGGGTSVVFGLPSWQPASLTGTTMRATPDLALHMGGCPSDAVQPCGPNRSYVIVQFGGQTTGAIGTSAASPSFAGVLALMEQYKGGRLGVVNPMIYTLSLAQDKGSLTKPFRKSIPGYNGVSYSDTTTANTAYNMVVGNGTLDIRAFIGATSLPAAGNPGTASNP